MHCLLDTSYFISRFTFHLALHATLHLTLHLTLHWQSICYWSLELFESRILYRLLIFQLDFRALHKIWVLLSIFMWFAHSKFLRISHLRYYVTYIILYRIILRSFLWIFIWSTHLKFMRINHYTHYIIYYMKLYRIILRFFFWIFIWVILHINSSTTWTFYLTYIVIFARRILIYISFYISFNIVFDTLSNTLLINYEDFKRFELWILCRLLKFQLDFNTLHEILRSFMTLWLLLSIFIWFTHSNFLRNNHFTHCYHLLHDIISKSHRF